MVISQGGTITTDVIGVECHKTDDVHLGLTVAYYGFMSDGKCRMQGKYFITRIMLV